MSACNLSNILPPHSNGYAPSSNSKHLLFALSLIIFLGSIFATALLFGEIGYPSFGVTVVGTLISVVLFAYSRQQINNDNGGNTVSPLVHDCISEHVHEKMGDSNDLLKVKDESESQKEEERILFGMTVVETNLLQECAQGLKDPEQDWFGLQRNLYFMHLSLLYSHFKITTYSYKEYECMSTSPPNTDQVCKNILIDFNTTDKDLAYDMSVGIKEDHSTLIYVDRKRKTIEYYDSKQYYDRSAEEKLKKVAKALSYKFIPKIKTCLQPDGYQCGP